LLKRQKSRPRTLRVRLTKRALERLHRIANQQNATPEQLVERMVGDFVSVVGAGRHRRRPEQPSPNGAQHPGYV